MNTRVQAMTSNAAFSVDMLLGNVSSNPSNTTTIIIPTWGPTVSAMSTVALSNTNQIESMHTCVASNVAHSVKEKYVVVNT
jgi:hypothetical protein